MTPPSPTPAHVRRQVMARAALTALIVLATVAGGIWLYHARMSTGAPIATDQVQLELNDFRPDAIKVPPGTTVTWHWDGRTSHNLIFDDGETVAARNHGTYRRTFTEPGVYVYRCTLHGPMKGQVEVRPPAT